MGEESNLPRRDDHWDEKKKRRATFSRSGQLRWRCPCERPIQFERLKDEKPAEGGRKEALWRGGVAKKSGCFSSGWELRARKEGRIEAGDGGGAGESKESPRQPRLELHSSFLLPFRASSLDTEAVCRSTASKMLRSGKLRNADERTNQNETEKRTGLPSLVASPPSSYSHSSPKVAPLLQTQLSYILSLDPRSRDVRSSESQVENLERTAPTSSERRPVLLSCDEVWRREGVGIGRCESDEGSHGSDVGSWEGWGVGRETEDGR